MKKKILVLLAIVGFFQSLSAQQIGDGLAPSLPVNFDDLHYSGAYTGFQQIGDVYGWQHLFVIRHGNPNNNYQLQIASSIFENDRLFFRKIAYGDLSIGTPQWYELATRGANTFTGNQVINGNIRTITQEFSNGGQDGGKIEAFRAPEQNNLFGLNFYTSVGYSTTGAGYQLAMSLRRVWGNGDYISKLNLNGILQSTTNSGSNIYLSKTTGSSIAFNNGAGTDHALIEANSTVNGLEFWTNPGSGISEAMRIIGNGNVLIGKTTQNDGVYYKLDVAGSIRANEIKVNMDGADFVFEPSYKLRPLNEVETFIKQNKHLPDVAPAAEMQTNGVSMGEMQAKLLQKVEELTLYVIEQNKIIEKQQMQILEMNKELKKLNQK